MKKTVFIFFISVFIFTACDNKPKTDKPDAEPVTEVVKKAEPVHLNKADFLAKVANYETTPSEWKYLGDKPALIDFYADWCGPCKMIAPFLEELASEYDGEVYIYKIDVDKEQELAQVFGISSIPSLLLVPMNDQPQMTQGAMSKEELKGAIDQVLLKK